MKKILLNLLLCLISLPVFAADLAGYIYGKAMIGDVEGLRNLAARGYSLEARDEDGNTAYCLAVFRRNQTAIRTLEQAGANIKPRCMKRVPVVTEAMIYEAAHNRNVKQITLWQEYGVPVDLVNVSDGNTALCQAVYEKDCEAIDILLKAGASEYHTCMRRVPPKVRQELDCKPVIIDWERVGLTALGVGLVAGGVAVALSGGGSSGESCAVNQHWDGEKCVTCPAMQCWDGTTCRVAYKGEYTDPVTNRCFQIAPPPYTDGTYTPASFETAEYKAGGFLGAINASDAYARGYTGYIVSRWPLGDKSPFGALTNGQSSEQGGAKDITDNRFTVAVLSTGTAIANTPKKDSNGNVVTDGNGNTVYTNYVNGDLAYEVEQKTNEETGEVTETPKHGTGIWRGNLATNSEGKLFGYNFDYGYIGYKDKAETATGYSGSQSWSITSDNKISIAEEHQNDRFDSSAAPDKSYYSGSVYYFTGESDKKTVYLVLKSEGCASGYCGIASADGSSPLPYKLVDLKECGTNEYCLAPPLDIDGYIYDTDYVYDKDNPAPHYHLNEDPTRSKQQGTMLAGIIAALKNGQGMHGVAYNTEVIPAVADIFRPITYNTIETLVNAGADVILQDVVFTSSAGYPGADYVKDKTMLSVFGEDTTKAYQHLVSTGTIFIVGTGTNGNNDISSGIVKYADTAESYQKDATISAGAPLASDGDKLKELFLSVAAVQENENASAYGGYTLTKYSQPCGSTGGFCLSAPGGTGVAGDKGSNGNLYTTVSTDPSNPEYNWGEDYGTSAAAAVVAGGVSLLKGAYPHLTNQEIVSLLKQTATPLGACAGATSDIDTCTSVTDTSGQVIGKYSTLYGWGLINLDAATKPVGALWVHNGSSTAINPYIGVYSISGSGLSTSSVMSQSLLNALPSSFAAFDSFDRPFVMDTSSFVSARSTRKEFDEDFKAFMHGRDVKKVKANDQFSMTYAPRTSDRSSEMKTGLMEMNVDLGRSNFGFYYTEDTLNSRGNYFERPLNNPFIQIQEAYGAEAKYNLTPKLSVGMSFATGKNGFLGDGDTHYKAPENRISMVATETTYQATKSVMFKASYGVMKEQDSVLGMTGAGAFKTAGANTNFASAGVEIKPTDKFKLNLVYTYGWTTPEKSDGLMNLSRLTADGFAAVAQYDLGSENMLGLSVSSPLRVRSGKVAFDLPVGRSETDDTIYRETFTGSMKPTARELDFALFYRDALTDALTIQSEVGVRLHPDHQKEAAPDYRALFGLKWDY
ncbi:MAG: S8 family serine peptidase [Alphaproteobacteria bacterium]